MLKTNWKIAAVLAFTAVTALAQTQSRTASLPEIDVSRLDLNPGAQDSLINATGRLNDQGSLRVGFTGLYLKGVGVSRVGPGTAFALLENRLIGIGSISWTPVERIEIYGNAPFVLYQDERRSLTRLGFKTVGASGMGQPLVGARVGILRQDTMPINLALGVAATLPVADTGVLASDRRSRIQPSLSFGRVMGDLAVGGEVRLRLRPQNNVSQLLGFGRQNPGDTVTHELGLGLSANYRVIEGLRVGVDVVGDMALSQGASGGGVVQPFLSARYQVMENMEAYGAIGTAQGKLVGTNEVQGFLGVAFTPGASAQATKKTTEPEAAKITAPVSTDDDGDGIQNRSDACPKQAEDKDGFQDSDGCPDEDNDSDGVPDAKDACPDQKGPPESAGCATKDADKDGVADVADRCPNEPGELVEGGCPVKDTDKDGVRDEQDLCPTEAGDKENRGCPEKDTDKDGVSDAVDNCLREKGTKENAGCPARFRQLVTITREKLVISDKVYFTPGKSTIMPKSRVLMDQIAKILKEHPEIPKIRIEGHTDNVGIPEKNVKLSGERAGAVRDYLVKAKVPAAKLEVQGFGQEKPIADNNTAQGRETNRRVEFVIVDAPDKTESKEELEPLLK